MKKLLASLAVVAGLFVGLSAQVSVPNVLISGTTIKAGDLNTNFSTLANHSVDRISGGNFSGNVTMDAGITIDGIDLSTALCTSCNATFAGLTASSLTSSGAITVNGVGIIAASGKIPALTATYFTSVDASTLTGLNAAVLASGTVPTARLGSGSATSNSYLRGDSSWVIVSVPISSAKTTTYTAVANDFILATGTFTVTLPAASSNANVVIDVKNGSTGTVTIGRTGSDTIDGATSQSLVTQYQSMTFFSDGTSWWIR